MSDLIEALQILVKYGDPRNPTHCEHDVMTFMVDPEVVSDDDIARLKELGVFIGNEYGDNQFQSYRFGSA